MFAHADFQNADDRPDAHDASKGVDHSSRRGSLEDSLPPFTEAAAEAAAAAAARSGKGQHIQQLDNDYADFSSAAAEEATKGAAEVGWYVTECVPAGC